MKEKRSYIPVGGDPIHMIFHSEHWEEVPDEDLWEDGELNQRQVQSKIYNNINKGIYQLIRRKND